MNKLHRKRLMRLFVTSISIYPQHVMRNASNAPCCRSCGYRLGVPGLLCSVLGQFRCGTCRDDGRKNNNFISHFSVQNLRRIKLIYSDNKVLFELPPEHLPRPQCQSVVIERDGSVTPAKCELSSLFVNILR